MSTSIVISDGPIVAEAMLNVAIVVSDEVQRARLQIIIARAGFGLVDLDEADVVLLDAEAPTTTKPVVTLGPHNEGRAGWLQPDASDEQIAAALRAVAVGLIVRPATKSSRSGFEELPERAAHVLLTPRELEVLAAIGAGLANKAIARQLGISLHTVKFHIESLFRKLGARSRAEAVAKGLERRVRETVEL
ncbi:MAG: response regulator transcription factor [Steroidobacteraceae bacterium]